MTGFYGEMREIASEILGEFKQGVVTLTQITNGPRDPATPHLPGPAIETVYPLDATVSTVFRDNASRALVEGSLIAMSDLVVTFAPPPVVPTLSDKLTIDGETHEIKQINAIPAAGTVVVYKLFVAS